MYKVKHQMVPGYFENIVKRNDLEPPKLRLYPSKIQYCEVWKALHQILGPIVMVQVDQLWEKCTNSERFQTNDKL